MVELAIGQEIVVSRINFSHYKDILKVNGYVFREVDGDDERIRIRITDKFCEEEIKARMDKELAEYYTKKKTEIENKLVEYEKRRRKEIDEELKKIVIHHKISLAEKYGTNRPYAIENQEMVIAESKLVECEIKARYGKVAQWNSNQ